MNSKQLLDSLGESGSTPEERAIFIKATEIANFVLEYTHVIQATDERILYIKQFLLDDAIVLPTKIASSTGSAFYDEKLECAVLVRQAAQNILLQSKTLTMFGIKPSNYHNKLVQSLEEFRSLYKDWIRTFDSAPRREDPWGLFNPKRNLLQEPSSDSDLLYNQ
ncbi:hypothetical protein GYB22_08355 [bacterium]|nr:hypothetical protein [bacterium]